jgi:hypothetical protein
MLLMKKGAVDLMIEQWARERPDLDSSSLSVLARISRLARVAEDDADKVLSQFDLSSVEFHLLAAIRTTPDEAHGGDYPSSGRGRWGARSGSAVICAGPGAAATRGSVLRSRVASGIRTR